MSLFSRENKLACSSQSFYKHLKKYFPILSWLPRYTLQDFKGDSIAGFTVGLTVVPQGLALAQLANLPPQYGLYTAFMGSFMYTIFGTCKDLVIGPTSVMALMTAEYALIGGPPYAALLSFLCGCFQLVLGLLNLGFLVNFISAPVLSGFTSAAATITATSQLKGILGLKFKSYGFPNTVYNLFKHISQTNYYDLSMGITSIVFLLLLRQFKDKKLSACKGLFLAEETLQVFWWFFATARNAIMVIFCSTISSICLSFGIDVLTLTQHVDAGLPAFSLPQFTQYTFDPLTNITISKSTADIFKDLGSGAFVIPFLSLLEAIAIAKTFTRGIKLDATREMVALGMGNLIGSLVSAYPVTGSFSRSVINNSSGVRTPLGGIISGSFVLLALCVIAPSFHYIPKSCLSAIIFSAVIFMIHYKDVPAMWNTNKVELVPFCTTFICSMIFGLEYGLLFGVAVALGILMYRQNKVNISIHTKKMEKGHVNIHITPENSIYFPSADYFKGSVSKALYSNINIGECTLIIYGDNLTDIDYTTAMGIKNMIKSIKKDNVPIIFKITKPSAFKALSFLKDSVVICKNEEELQNLLQGMDQNDVHESSSSAHLLAKSDVSVETDQLNMEEELHVNMQNASLNIV